jgi:hypothetical protein
MRLHHCQNNNSLQGNWHLLAAMRVTSKTSATYLMVLKQCTELDFLLFRTANLIQNAGEYYEIYSVFLLICTVAKTMCKY